MTNSTVQATGDNPKSPRTKEIGCHGISQEPPNGGNPPQHELLLSENEVGLPRCYPRCCGRPLFRGNKDTLGYALDLMARSTVFACAGAFLLPALLKMAKLEAGCEIEPTEGTNKVPDCHGKVYGIRPSSLLTTILTVVAVLSTAMLPLVGAIVDTTTHRRAIGRCLAFLSSILLFPTIFVNQDNWFAISVDFIVLGFVGWLLAMVNYAYLPELTNDQTILNEFTRGISILSFTFIVLCLAITVGVSAGFDLMDNYETVAHISQSITFGLFVLSVSVSWGFLYGTRPAAHTLPQGHSVWTAGFVQLYATICKIHRHYPALRWYYIAITLSNAAVGALLVISMTFMTDQLDFSSQVIGTCVTIMLLFSIPGAILSSWITKHFNPLNSSILSLMAMCIVTTLVSVVLKEPGQEVDAYLLSASWGVAMGWNFTVDRMMIASLVPPGQEAELMGLFLFAGQGLNWLPPLIYTSLNEANVSPRVGMAMLNLFFVLGMICYLLMGKYSKARAAVAGVPVESDPKEGATTAKEGTATATAVGNDPLQVIGTT